MSRRLDRKSRVRIMTRSIIQLIVLYVSMFAVIFGTAGRWDYWQGWIYFIMWILIHFLNSILMPIELIEERSKINEETKKWDVVIYGLIAVLGYIVPLIASLDGGRYQWTRVYPIWINVFAFLLLFLGAALFLYSMKTNPFFSATVRIQKDRGQFVIDKGPYAFIRHPGYASMIVSYVVVGFAMNSVWALIPGGVMAILFIIRTYLEDITLQNELSGYAEYASRVKYRIFPGIW